VEAHRPAGVAHTIELKDAEFGPQDRSRYPPPSRSVDHVFEIESGPALQKIGGSLPSAGTELRGLRTP
jgi:hypothetical protein